MPLYKAIILEDDLSIALDYEMLLKKMGIRVIGVHKSWKEVGHTIAKSRPDFMIVDLFLANNETGLEFLEKYKSLFIPAIVITGYPQKLTFDLALSLNVAAFLKKPADNSELTFTIKKLISDISNRNEKRDFIIVKERGAKIKVPYRKIMKVIIEGNYSTLLLENEKRFVVKSSLTSILEKLDKKKFFRCHRSTVVNFDHVIEFDNVNYKIRLTNGEELAVGVRFRTKLRALFDS